MESKELIADEQNYLVHTYKRPAMILDHGEGMKVWDLGGRQYYDFIGGIAVNSLGYSHPRIVQAICQQAGKLVHCSNLFYNAPQILLGKKLVEISCGDKAFFANSGAEVNEAALKMAVKYYREQNKEKYKIIYMENSFHGRTIATLAATGKYKYQKDYLLLLPSFKQAIFNDLNSVQEAYDEKVAAVIVEPIQGEGGINLASADFLEGLRDFCNSKDLLLIFDEIQCGLGRTGKMFAYQHYNIEPDILTLAKPIAGGLPLGALIAKEKVASVFKPGDHGTTFGGNPVACATALAFLEVLQEDNLLTECQQKGEYFKKRLEELKVKYPDLVKEVRVIGLMAGLEVAKEGSAIVQKMLDKGILINCTAEKVLRFLPPLIVEKNEIDLLIRTLDEVISDLK
ncbi:MAG: aspartate aminotransferase family protein [Atribacterota bacterium]|nr:aspartate aminotransferase family protein [Atribacterota bacterium]MDD4896045.1 aspartate aminotransferase family protein [Atribacterota bacterium]MDD5637304.1 aspartate aminotransferase family protein [Atribacterota bacterium]